MKHKVLMWKSCDFGDDGSFDGDFIGKVIGVAHNDQEIIELKDHFLFQQGQLSEADFNKWGKFHIEVVG